MKIGIVGYQGSGKSTLFEWLSGVAADPALAHATQSEMVAVPDERMAPLCEIYQSKKVTRAAINLVDTPGLSRTHEGSAGKLAMIREAGCLVVVVGAFGGADAVADLKSFEDDLLIADLEIVSGRVERLRDTVKKPRPNRDELQMELAALEPLLDVLEAGTSLRAIDISLEQQRLIKAFQLFSDKPRLVIANTADDESQSDKSLDQVPTEFGKLAVSLSLQLELSKMSAEERAEFCDEMQVTMYDRDTLIRDLMDASGQFLYFTAGDKEVRSWLLRQGGTALEAAAEIHTDLARGFIRAETMASADLIRLGSEREVKAQKLLRQEPKDYVVKDGDVILVRFSV